jgi:NSS family neurotransmitter:Na+ symporter
LPLGGLSIALFTGWVMSGRVVRDELHIPQAWLYRAWYVLIRYVAPLGIALVFLNLLGVV